MHKSILRLFLALAAAFGAAAGHVWADGSTSEWLAENAVPKTTEKQVNDDQGNLQTVVVEQEYKVSVHRKSTEVRHRDKNGSLVLSSRKQVTKTSDTFGGHTTVIEELEPGRADMVVTRVEEKRKTPTGYVHTVQERDKNGNLVMTRRITQSVNEEGERVKTVEQRGADGIMHVKEIVTEETD